MHITWPLPHTSDRTHGAAYTRRTASAFIAHIFSLKPQSCVGVRRLRVPMAQRFAQRSACASGAPAVSHALHEYPVSVAGRTSHTYELCAHSLNSSTLVLQCT